MAEVRLVDVTKRFGNVLAVDRISLDVHTGEFVGLLDAHLVERPKRNIENLSPAFRIVTVQSEVVDLGSVG